jgi:hypothetical protein
VRKIRSAGARSQKRPRKERESASEKGFRPERESASEKTKKERASCSAYIVPVVFYFSFKNYPADAVGSLSGGQREGLSRA